MVFDELVLTFPGYDFLGSFLLIDPSHDDYVSESDMYRLI